MKRPAFMSGEILLLPKDSLTFCNHLIISVYFLSRKGYTLYPG